MGGELRAISTSIFDVIYLGRLTLKYCAFLQLALLILLKLLLICLVCSDKVSLLGIQHEEAPMSVRATRGTGKWSPRIQKLSRVDDTDFLVRILFTSTVCELVKRLVNVGLDRGIIGIAHGFDLPIDAVEDSTNSC